MIFPKQLKISYKSYITRLLFNPIYIQDIYHSGAILKLIMVSALNKQVWPYENIEWIKIWYSETVKKF